MPEDNRLNERADHLRKIIKDRYAVWCQDREMFFKLYPNVTLTLPAGRCSPADEMRAVAATVMDASGFDWRVIPTADGGAVFMIGQYNGLE